MRTEDLVLISVDDHVVEPPDMFERHIPAEYRDEAPRLIHREDGSDAWLFQGKELPNIGLNAVAGRPPEEYGLEPTSFEEMREGTWDIHKRVRDMDANGVLGSMCFPSFPQLCGQLFARTKDKDLALAVLQAYNDWHIDDWSCERHHPWTGQDFGDQLPSQVFKERIVTCFIDDPTGIEMRHRVGIDSMCWEADYPHSDSTWPTSPERLMKSLDGVPDDEIEKMTYKNAMRHYRFNPFANTPKEECTVGALRARALDVDVTPMSKGRKSERDTKASDLLKKR